MRLADTRRTEQQQIGPLFQPTIAFDQRRYVGLRDGRHRGEVEAR